MILSWNISIPDSILKKKIASVSYHFSCEGESTDEWHTTYISTRENRLIS